MFREITRIYSLVAPMYGNYPIIAFGEKWEATVYMNVKVLIEMLTVEFNQVK